MRLFFFMSCWREATRQVALSTSFCPLCVESSTLSALFHGPSSFPFLFFSEALMELARIFSRLYGEDGEEKEESGKNQHEGKEKKNKNSWISQERRGKFSFLFLLTDAGAADYAGASAFLSQIDPRYRTLPLSNLSPPQRDFCLSAGIYLCLFLLNLSC